VQQLDFFCIECNFLRSTQLFLGLFALHSPSSTVLRLGGPLENSGRLINEGSVNKISMALERVVKPPLRASHKARQKMTKKAK
jgi:hypothetical protein